MDAIRISRRLCKAMDRLRFGPPTAYVYNPLDYASKAVDQYLERWARPGIEVLLLGMNPGPWGMAQTGIPFGEVNAVRDYLQIDAKVGRPESEHPKRPVDGLDCKRSEVSGRRLWGWAAERYPTADEFFRQFFVWNYCPLAFLEEGGRNRTPDKLPVEEREALFEPCDRALQELVEFLDPDRVVGVGAFATKRVQAVLPEVEVGTILHPSPASPAANRGWAPQAERQLIEMGITLPTAVG